MLHQIKEIFHSIFHKPEPVKVNDTPMLFTDNAIKKIKEQLNSRPKGIKVGFKIELIYNPEEVNYKVGFEEWSQTNSSQFHYPVPLMILHQDENYLLGSYIDYHAEEELFYIYPDITVTAEDTPKESIIKFNVNRLVVSKDSKNQEITISKDEFVKNKDTYHKLIQILFNPETMESMYMKSNFIQIEKSPKIDWETLEPEIVDTLLLYFEKTNYPVKME